MEITQAGKDDLPEMIALLKQSLGESLIPKSEAYFVWKHEKNPFGKSKILLAKENGKIIGLRAFMHWRWVSSTEIIPAVRAVDTATDPAYQGKGIFKKLTLQAVEECKQEGVGLVFNSPNPMSMQGYLKMGWYGIGRMPIYLGPGSMVPRLYSEKAISKSYQQYDVNAAIEKLDKNWSVSPADILLHTPLSHAYFKWRYSECPVAKYGAVIEPGKFGFIFRLKKINRFIELRICELWTEKAGTTKQARRAFKKLVRKIRPAVVSCAPSPLFNNDKRRLLGLYGPFRRGPVTTLRPLAKEKLNNFDQFYQWQPSIGSMELF